MFSYLGVLISVILGLALTHLLRGLSKLVQLRDTVKPYWVHVVWTVNVILYILGIWWGMYWWNKLDTWTTELFLFLSAYSIVIFLLSSLLYPAEFPHDMNFENYFYKNKTWFFGLLTASLLLDIPETYRKGAAHLRDVPKEYIVFLPACLLIVSIAAFSNNRRVQATLCLAWLAVILAYMNLSALENIAG
jgi:hypothetical protein